MANRANHRILLASRPGGEPGLQNFGADTTGVPEADVFETVSVIRLVNRGQPRTEFN